MEDKCMDYKLQIQALADAELDLNDTDTTKLFYHLSSCSSCRNEYYSTVKLKKSMKVAGDFKPSDDWMIQMEKRRSSKIVRRVGFFLMGIPYLLLISLGIWEFLKDDSEGLLIKIAIGSIISGVLLLLLYTIAGHIKESKTDKYKEIIR